MSSTTQTRLVPELEPLPSETVLSGPAVLTAAVAPEELSERAGVAWADVDNELGPSMVAVLELAEGRARFALTCYPEAPYEAVTVSADETVTNDDIDALLKALRIKKSEVLDRIDPEDFRRPARPAKPGPRGRTAKTAARKSGKGSGGRSAKAPVKALPRGRARTRAGASAAARQILAIVSEQPGITHRALAKQLTLNDAQLSKALARVEESGKIRKKGRGLHPVGR